MIRHLPPCKSNIHFLGYCSPKKWRNPCKLTLFALHKRILNRNIMKQIHFGGGKNVKHLAKKYFFILGVRRICWLYNEVQTHIWSNYYPMCGFVGVKTFTIHIVYMYIHVVCGFLWMNHQQETHHTAVFGLVRRIDNGMV